MFPRGGGLHRTISSGLSFSSILHRKLGVPVLTEPELTIMPVRINSLIGNASDENLEPVLHRLEHRGQIEYVTVAGADLARKRFRVFTDGGTECAIALPRSTELQHGSVLLLEQDRAIVVRLEELPWLVLEARDRAAALKLGFLAGHHHWRTKFDEQRMHVALEQATEFYLDRLRAHLDEGTVLIVEGPGD
jgi:urease accessory protein